MLGPMKTIIFIDGHGHKQTRVLDLERAKIRLWSLSEETCQDEKARYTNQAEADAIRAMFHLK